MIFTDLSGKLTGERRVQVIADFDSEDECSMPADERDLPDDQNSIERLDPSDVDQLNENIKKSDDDETSQNNPNKNQMVDTKFDQLKLYLNPT